VADERGASVVEFAAVTILAVVALLAVVQLALWVWARNVAFDAAHDGVRAAAVAGQPLTVGVDRARSLLRAGLGGGAAAFTVDAGKVGDDVVVVARGNAPAVLPLLPRFSITARAVAFDEDGVFG